MSEPGTQAKQKVSPQLEVNEWSVLEVENGSSLSLGQLISDLEQKSGLKVWDIFKED